MSPADLGMLIAMEEVQGACPVANPALAMDMGAAVLEDSILIYGSRPHVELAALDMMNESYSGCFLPLAPPCIVTRLAEQRNLEEQAHSSTGPVDPKMFLLLQQIYGLIDSSLSHEPPLSILDVELFLIKLQHASVNGDQCKFQAKLVTLCCWKERCISFRLPNRVKRSSF